jgi:hypothetical protein
MFSFTHFNYGARFLVLTGEDWLDTSLELSTAFPSRMRDASQPHRTSVSYTPQRAHQTMMTRGIDNRQRMKAARAPMMESLSMDAGTVMMDVDVAVAEVEVSSTGDLGAAVVFTLPHKHSILTGREKASLLSIHAILMC